MRNHPSTKYHDGGIEYAHHRINGAMITPHCKIHSRFGVQIGIVAFAELSAFVIFGSKTFDHANTGQRVLKLGVDV